MAQWLSAFISQIEPDTLYIDLGANLGIHGLHAAKSNCTVWAVEPQEQNLQKVRWFLLEVSFPPIWHFKIATIYLFLHRLFTPAFFLGQIIE